jgi:homoserine O-acetyltransferase
VFRIPADPQRIEQTDVAHLGAARQGRAAVAGRLDRDARTISGTMSQPPSPVSPTGTEGVFTLPGPFRFESGDTLPELRVGYTAHGCLNAARDNAILVLPGTSNTRHSTDGYIGPGNAFDTDRFFVIATDAIGGGTSSSPADGLGGAFPRYGIRDMVRAAYALVAGHFGIARLVAVAGASMGAFQALEWTIHEPDAAGAAILLVPGWRASRVFRLAVDAAIGSVMLDPDWNDGRYARAPIAGLRGAGRIYYPWTVTDAWIDGQPADRIEHELQGTIARAAQWDAWSYVRRYQASAAHDATAPFGADLGRALAGVRARVLLLPAAADRILPAEGAREIARHLKDAECAEIPGQRGHMAWRPVAGTPETAFVVARIRRFLGLAG